MNALVVAISIVLLPGLIASVICDKITVHSPRWDAFKYSIYSFIFGVFSYVLLQAIKFLLYLSSTLCFIPKVADYKLGVWSIIQQSTTNVPQVPLLEVGYATILALPIAFFSSWVVNHKIINKFATRYGISQKYGDENLFSYFLNIQEVSWVYVLDKEKDLTYMGEVVSFSECDNIQEVLLRDVSVFKYDNSKFLYKLSMVYLSKPVGSFVIEVPAVSDKENINAENTN